MLLIASDCSRLLQFIRYVLPKTEEDGRQEECRVYYSCVTKLRGWVPAPVYGMMTKAALKQTTSWLDVEAVKAWQHEKEAMEAAGGLDKLARRAREIARDMKMPMLPTLPLIELPPGVQNFLDRLDGKPVAPPKRPDADRGQAPPRHQAPPAEAEMEAAAPEAAPPAALAPHAAAAQETEALQEEPPKASHPRLWEQRPRPLARLKRLWEGDRVGGGLQKEGAPQPAVELMSRRRSSGRPACIAPLTPWALLSAGKATRRTAAVATSPLV